MARSRFPFKHLLLIVQVSLRKSDDFVAKGGGNLFQSLVTSLTVTFVSSVLQDVACRKDSREIEVCYHEEEQRAAHEDVVVVFFDR